MAHAHKKRRGSGGKLAIIFLLLIVGGLALMATRDIAPPTKTITKTLTPAAE